MTLGTFGKLLVEFSTKVNLVYFLYYLVSIVWYIPQRCCLLHLIKKNRLLKTFLRTPILTTWVFLYLFSFLQVVWNCIAFKMIKKVLMNFDSSKASGPNSIPMMVLKNCEPELSYMLGELFNICLNESYFLDCWKVSSVVHVFKNVGERSTAKNYRPVSILSKVSKVFEKTANNRILDHLEK